MGAVIRAKSHKFENYYEMLCGVRMTMHASALKIGLKVDHGS